MNLIVSKNSLLLEGLACDNFHFETHFRHALIPLCTHNYKYKYNLECQKRTPFIVTCQRES